MTEFKQPEKTISQKLVAPGEEANSQWNTDPDDLKNKKRKKALVRAAILTMITGCLIYLGVPHYIESKAWAYIEKEDYRKALEILNSSPWDANMFTFIYARASCYTELKQYQQAADAYTRLIRTTPNEDFSYLARGDCYFQLQRYDLAVADYNQAIQLNPKSPWAYSSRADLYKRTGKTLLAKKDSATAARLKAIRDREERDEEAKAEASANSNSNATPN